MALTKPIKFITTFSKSGYELYGKTWIDTFTSNVKDSSITADIYVDFPITVSDTRIRIVDFNTNITGHDQWVNDFNKLFKGQSYNKTMAVRFSYKAFVMLHAFNTTDNQYVIWLDGDCVYKNHPQYTSLGNLLNGKVIAVQREANGGDDHCESGFVLFDPDHDDAPKFINQLAENYKINNVLRMDTPYDGFIIYKSLLGIEYIDLNQSHGENGIQSDPQCTFLHPELAMRFVHNIGPIGKSNYEAWEECRQTDAVFKLITGKVGLTPEQISQTRYKLVRIRDSVIL